MSRMFTADEFLPEELGEAVDASTDEQLIFNPDRRSAP